MSPIICSELILLQEVNLVVAQLRMLVSLQSTEKGSDKKLYQIFATVAVVGMMLPPMALVI